MAKKNGSTKGLPSGESIQGYFRPIIIENPRFLKSRSNQKLLDRWLEDHPGYTEVPHIVRTNLSNLKSVLRSRRRKRTRAATEAAPGHADAVTTLTPKPAGRKAKLETLEERIDDCLTMARDLGYPELGDAIMSLRRARNEVVWQLGE